VESRSEKYSRATGHVVGVTGVEVPFVDHLVTCALPEEGVSSRLVEVEECGDGQHVRGAQLDTPMHQEQGRLVVDPSLRDVNLTATLRLPAVLGPMVSIATVVAGVAAGGLALAGVAAISASAIVARAARLHTRPSAPSSVVLSTSSPSIVAAEDWSCIGAEEHIEKQGPHMALLLTNGID
jgi:hypothetical protein